MTLHHAYKEQKLHHITVLVSGLAVVAQMRATICPSQHLPFDYSITVIFLCIYFSTTSLMLACIHNENIQQKTELYS